MEYIVDYLFDALFFDAERWEKAIAKGKEKDIDKCELSKLCDPAVREWLALKIANGEYKIAPPHMAKIPKDKPGEFRIVYVNEPIDRVLLSMINDLFMEKFGKDMIHESCKSYQSGIGCGKVVKEVVKHMNIDGEIVGWKSDLSKYFDSVKIDDIDDELDFIEFMYGESCIIDLVKAYYHQDLCFDENGKLVEKYQSLKQGCAVASFLADTILFAMDMELTELAKKNGGYYCRYSDDCLYVGAGYEDAMKLMKAHLRQFGLKVNPKKIQYLRKDEWFKFLGFMIKGAEISLSASRVHKFQKEIEARTIKGNHSSKGAINSVNRYLYGGKYSWAAAVLPVITVKHDIDEMNNFAMDCIRATITGKKKVGQLKNVITGDYTIVRGHGKNVAANRRKTPKEIDGYLSLGAARNVILTNREAYDTVIRVLSV